MSTLLAESFDQYASSGGAADMTSIGWTIGSLTITTSPNTPFSQGQVASIFSTSVSSYNWGSNETTVYGSFFYLNRSASSSSQYVYFSFTDAGTAQCTIRLNMDGSVGLYTGGPTGTLISTTSSIFTGGVVTTPWTSFQFKIVINNTTGSIEIRQNGGPSNVITQTNVNTRGGTSNSYVNAIAIASTGASGTGVIDNLFLNNTSGNAPTSWPGEMRALQQTPLSVVTPNFSLFPVSTDSGAGNNITTQSCTNGNSYYAKFSSPATGTIGTVSMTTNAGATANVKMSIFDATGASAGPGTSLGSANVVANPATGANTFTFSSPVGVISGTAYWLGFSEDATVVWRMGNTGANWLQALSSSPTAYASFPATNPTITGIANFPVATITVTNTNAQGVNDLTENQDTTYIYTASNVEDKYNMSAVAASTYQIIAVQYYAMWKKSDVGTRTAALSVTANGSSDTNLTSVTPTFVYAYSIKTLELDPTGAAWTPTNVNGAVVGITAS